MADAETQFLNYIDYIREEFTSSMLVFFFSREKKSSHLKEKVSLFALNLSD